MLTSGTFLQPSRAKLLEPWPAGPQGSGLRRLDKLKASLDARLPPEWSEDARADFLGRLDAVVASAWAAAAHPKAVKPKP